MPPLDDDTRCTGTKKDGTPCRSPRIADDTRCAHHSSRYTDAEKASWGRTGALVLRRRASQEELQAAAADAAEALAVLPGGKPELRTPAGVTALLEAVAVALVTKALAPSAAAVLVKVCEAASKNLDVEIASQLQAVIEERKRHLKASGAWR